MCFIPTQLSQNNASTSDMIIEYTLNFIFLKIHLGWAYPTGDEEYDYCILKLPDIVLSVWLYH